MTDPGSDLAAPVDISVVIPNFDGAKWLEGCLPSLRSGATSARTEVIVADDGSSDRSAAVCERHGARLVTSTRRGTGFAATANRGIRVATGRWILLLNNDTFVAPGSLDVLLDVGDRRPDVAMVAPFVLSLRDRTSVDSAGMLLFPDGTARPRWHGEAATDVPLHGEEEVLVPSGAAAMFRSSWIERVGMLDEGMGSYLEDIDLGLRIRRAGGGAVFTPDAVVYHHFSGTTSALSPHKARMIERNHITVAARHLPLRWLIALPVWTLVRWAVMVRTVAKSRDADHGHATSLPATAIAVVQGSFEGIVRLPAAVRERRRDAAGSAVDSQAWYRLLNRFRARPGDYRKFGA